MARGDPAVALDPGPDPHQHRMPAPVGVEDFLARERDLHGAPGDHRQFRRADLVAEGIALAPEPAPDRRRDHPDPAHREVEDLGQGPVDIVRRLGRGPEHEAAAGLDLRNRAVLLHRQVGVPLEEEHILADVIGLRESALEIAKFQ